MIENEAGAIRIYLARHGQSQWQVERSENWNTSLTAVGHEQSKRMGQWLADHETLDIGGRLEVSCLCASPSRRAQETAAYAADALNLPISTLHNLCEASFHVADHLPQSGSPLEVRSGYELCDTYLAFKSQAQTALRGLVETAEDSGGPVLTITHSGLIKTMLRLVMGSDAVCFRIYNTGLNLVEWRRGRWHLVHLNLWDHLPTELRTF